MFSSFSLSCYFLLDRVFFFSDNSFPMLLMLIHKALNCLSNERDSKSKLSIFFVVVYFFVSFGFSICVLICSIIF